MRSWMTWSSIQMIKLRMSSIEDTQNNRARTQHYVHLHLQDRLSRDYVTLKGKLRSQCEHVTKNGSSISPQTQDCDEK